MAWRPFWYKLEVERAEVSLALGAVWGVGDFSRAFRKFTRYGGTPGGRLTLNIFTHATDTHISNSIIVTHNSLIIPAPST